MYKMNDFLVGLDLSAMDNILLEYVAKVAEYLKPEKIYLMHVGKEIDLPADIMKEYPGLVKPLSESIKEELTKKRDKYFSDDLKNRCEFIIDEGNLEKKIIKVVKKKDVELVFLGRKTELKGEGVKANKLAKLLPCTIAFIPEVLPSVLKKVLVPTDFSVPSKLAVQFASLLAEMNETAELTCFHAYNVPLGYSSTGKSKQEFADIMESNAKKRFAAYKNDLDAAIEIACSYKLTEQGEESGEIYRHAVSEKYDAVVIGSKGRTGVASLLLGSTAEKLLDFSKQIPIFIVKNKKKNMGFIDALLNL
jgi:nucleotide-binding universal stress UspA family protein